MITRLLTHQERQAQRNNHARDVMGLVRDQGNYQVSRDPEYDYLQRAESFSNRANNLRTQAIAQRAENSAINTANLGNAQKANASSLGPVAAFPVPAGKFGDFLSAISAQESGGDYSAVNSSSGALGKYQIMPANIPSWSQEALGHQVSTQRFLNNPRLQETIARHMLQNMFQSGGARGAASQWYSGGATNWRTNPDVANYVMEVLARMG